MSDKSNNQGRAYEYAWCLALEQKLSVFKKVIVDKQNGFNACYRAYESLEKSLQDRYLESAKQGVLLLLDCEPLLNEVIESSQNEITLSLQKDKLGEIGDIRDILIYFDRFCIGLSIKHNHDAVKHSRLSKDLDFGKKWLGVGVSQNYKDTIKPLFERLENAKKEGMLWRDFPNKEQEIYAPLLQAFKKEVLRIDENKKNKVPQKMVEYLLGKYDFYKAILLEREQKTKLEAYHFNNTLNRSVKNKPKRIIPLSKLPTRMIYFDFKPKSFNTLELVLDEGWSFSLRIHNASSRVEPSLKFDIKLLSKPESVAVFIVGF
ncbi:HaeIII family restriction endonuclease [Helicobacter pylori]|uniref:HaeIII family restriction endonuclease n=2 Tax=Helicobacter pylori TaxID=210 RepID=A0AAE7P6F2_HELPX|nr:HaeIII family restriction endonuclease [Helicobacter pylori]ACD47960.1 type II restriction endonuclease [Helicobacter pylori Shi470]ADO04064.1 type II restriction endonuclease [Helicobacter pylori Cuz20]AEN18534.1 type II restriction endonuclease [Helicobacter pylori Puno135]AFI00763.1 type II restriction endonuclease [Helicobacter pylori Shi112]QQW93467.1 HaeIII family restriction endonuclease [Helicobacter pylori]